MFKPIDLQSNFFSQLRPGKPQGIGKTRRC
jgi:hypothetical protein